MRVALFFDGKNFYSGWRDQTNRQQLDFMKMAQWLVTAAGGTRLWAAHYYTGVESGSESASPGQQSLGRFLDWLDEQPGYFVQRFPRRQRSVTCEHCQHTVRYTEEKEVDTTLVADMVRLAAVGAYDIAVLVSGDGDFGCALDAVRALGKQTFVATWGSTGLSSRLRRASFDRLNLLDGLDEFSRDTPAPGTRAPVSEHEVPSADAVHADEHESTRDAEVPSPDRSLATDPIKEMDAALEAALGVVKIAEAWFAERGRYLGANYFVTRWQSDQLPANPEKRREQLAALESLGRIEFYTAPGGDAAMRTL